MRAKLFFFFSTMCLVMMLRTAYAQADCPNGEDYSPCTCSSTLAVDQYSYRVACSSIPLAENANVFRRTTTADLEGFYLYLQPDRTQIIPADLLNNHRTARIDIICRPAGSPLIVDSEALRSSQNLLYSMFLYDCDMSQLNFDFLSGFNQFLYTSWKSMSNVGQANWASFPLLPSLNSLNIYQSTGLNEWMTFPKLAKGLTYLEIRKCDIQDEAMNRLLNWTRQYSANTLNFLYIDQNELTQIPKQLQAPNSFPNLQVLYLQDQKTGIPLITTGSISCPPGYPFNYQLNANNNRITTIDAGAFEGNCGGAKILLYSNLLSRFDEATFKEVLIQMRSSNRTGGELIVANNPFNCELDPCHLAWLIRDNRDLLSYLYGAACSNGTQFIELNPSGLTSCPTNGNRKY